MHKPSTKEKILKAARQLFTEHGFAGTSMGKIAKLASVNHSLPFHYFDNKENLWLAVKQTIARDAEHRSKILPHTNLPLKSFLKELIVRGIRFYQEHPDIVRMINWQRLEYNTTKNISITLSTEVKEWISAFKHYQKKGEMNPTLKPEFVMTFILALISSAALDKNVFTHNKTNRDKYVSFCVETLANALSM